MFFSDTLNRRLVKVGHMGIKGVSSTIDQLFVYSESTYTLNKKSLTGQGKSMVTVLRKKFLVQWRNLHDFTATSIQLYDSLLVGYHATHTGKGKKLSDSVFYWVIKKILRVYNYIVDLLLPNQIFHMLKIWYFNGQFLYGKGPISFWQQMEVEVWFFLFQYEG